MNNFGEVSSATGNMLQVSADNLEQIVDTMRKMKKTLGTCVDPSAITHQENLRQINAASSMMCVATTALMGSLFARDIKGTTPMEHLAYYFTEAMEFTQEKQTNVRVEVSEDSNK